MNRVKLKDRVLPTYTKGEEIINMTSHIVGGALGIVGWAFEERGAGDVDPYR